jgi:DNA ligase (NAD+)
MSENTNKNSIAKQYYEGGNSPLTDPEWDALYDGLEEIGYTPESGVPHKYQMYSLQKTFDNEELENWLRVKHEGQLVTCTPKLDGAAVSIMYRDGNLSSALTRGNGKIGLDILNKIQYLVPTKINYLKEIQIDGEVVAPTSIPNARNYAAGSLNLKDPLEFKARCNELRFVAYDMRPYFIESWVDVLYMVESFGISTVYYIDASLYPQDGRVFRLDDTKYWSEQGFTAHHPRGSLAFKEQKDGVITTLKDVEWQTGKSGVVTPVAILEPVMIGDALVQRATLHNMAHIEQLGLEIGCKVEVIRSGEIIPRIVRRVEEK